MKKVESKKKLTLVPDELSVELGRVKSDVELGNLGFKCVGQLCENVGYENFSERIWLWCKVVDDEIYTAGAFDLGGSCCDVIMENFYVPELFNESC